MIQSKPEKDRDTHEQNESLYIGRLSKEEKFHEKILEKYAIPTEGIVSTKKKFANEVIEKW